jgi:N-acetylmuramate 1-kinase
VPQISQTQLESWIVATVARLWPEGRLALVTALKGDASERRFWRIHLDESRGTPLSAVAVDLGPDDFPVYLRALNTAPQSLSEPPWLTIHRFLAGLGVAVPEIYATDISARMLLIEDIGSLSLLEAAARGDAGDLYRLAVDELLIFHTSGTSRLDSDCIAAKIAYDRRLFRWELAQFLEVGLGEIAPGADHDAVAHELDDLAERLHGFPRVFSHRDYHGQNLFVQCGREGWPRLRVIDFQDALMAPAAQDLAVLLTTRDAARVIPPRLEGRLLDYYYSALLRRHAPRLSFEEFRESYRLCVLQHALKVIGRFIVLERQGKSGYREYIPYAREQARRMLTTGKFLNLRSALGA